MKLIHGCRFVVLMSRVVLAQLLREQWGVQNHGDVALRDVVMGMVLWVGVGLGLHWDLRGVFSSLSGSVSGSEVSPPIPTAGIVICI